MALATASEPLPGRVGRGSIAPAMTITEAGLVLGATVLAPMPSGAGGKSEIAGAGAEERILALLAVAYGKPVDPSIIRNIRRASRYDNPDQPRVPAGNPDGGQWTSDGSGADQPEERVRAPLFPVDYTQVHGLPSDAKVVIPRDGVPILDENSPTKFLMAPPRADFREVYTAGRAIRSSPLSVQYDRARAAIAQEGTYDFERDVPQQKFSDAYVHAANYAVGVYMAGAGYSLETTRAFAKL